MSRGLSGSLHIAALKLLRAYDLRSRAETILGAEQSILSHQPLPHEALTSLDAIFHKAVECIRQANQLEREALALRDAQDPWERFERAYEAVMEGSQ